MKIRQALKSHGLRETAFRRLALQAFYNSQTALNLEDLRQVLPEDSDRITLYRTLQQFEKQGLIHSIADADGGLKYALCHASCDAHGHHDSHAHFTCEVCHNTWCLEHWQAPQIQDEQIARILSSDLIVKGICAICAD